MYGLTSSGCLVYAYRDVIDCIIMVATTPRYGPFVWSHTAFVAAACVCVFGSTQCCLVGAPDNGRRFVMKIS